MRIQRFPESVTFDRSILWQYNNATALRRIVSLFNDMMEFSSLKLWRVMINTFNLEQPDLSEWDNYALKNWRIGGEEYDCTRIYFMPEMVGMQEGDSLRYITVRTIDVTTEPPEDYASLIPGVFRVKLWRVGAPVDKLIAVSTPVTVGPDDFNKDIAFYFTEYKETLTTLTSGYLYYIEFQRKESRDDIYWGDVESSDSDASTSDDSSSSAEDDYPWVIYPFNPSVFKTESSDGFYISSPEYQPIMKFAWYSTLNLPSEEMTLMLLAALFGVNNPGYSVGTDAGIPLNVFRRYLKSQIYLMDCNGSYKDLNSWAQITFPGAMCLINDRHDMTIAYNFAPALIGEDKILYDCMVEQETLPHPAGVLIGDAAQIKDKKFAMINPNASEASIEEAQDYLGALNESRFADPETPLPDGTMRPNDANYREE